MITNKLTQESISFIDEVIGSKITFGNMLESIRKSDNISQASFAQMLGISRQYLCDIEHNRKIVSPKMAYEYAKKLEYDREVFVLLALQSELDRDGLPFEVSFKHHNLSDRV